MPLSNETQNIIREQFVALPKDVQDAILSPTLRNALDDLQTKHALSAKQSSAVENETLFIMLGLEHPSDYIKNLSHEGNLPPEKARAIATEVNEQLFKPIRESLKKIHGIGDEKKEPPLSVSSIKIPTSNFQPPTSNFQSGFYPRAEVKKTGGIGTPSKPARTLEPQIQNTEYRIPDTKTNLPNDVKTAIASVQVTEQIQSIGKKHALHIDTMGTLLEETHKVMRGETHPKDYIRNLQNKLGVPSEKARAVATDVNEWVFKPIRESLKKIHGIGEEKKEPPPVSSIQYPVSSIKTPAFTTSNTIKTEAKTQNTEYRIQNTEYRIKDTMKEGAVQAQKPFFVSKPEETKKAAPQEYLDREAILRGIEEPERRWVTPREEKRGLETRPSATEPKQEIPPTSEPVNLVQKKLEDAFSLKREESHYTETPKRPGNDPYREAIK